ncbi:MAG: CotH kinase family protein [Acidimicrobiia bacterium]|nr:CotH kinase family protein [Acidimicrobiia bacterium]
MRLPLSWRRHWKLVVVSAVTLLALVFALGGVRPAARTDAGGHPRKGDIAGTVDLFDETQVHTIAIAFDTADYEAVAAEFAATGDKEFFQGDVVIDGTPVRDVGIRLKGNSTLFGPGPGAWAPGENQEAAPTHPIVGQDPADLPWLISFGEYIGGQTYQGHEAIAVRPAGLQGTMETALNEALSLSLIDLAGEPAEEAAYAALSVNGSAATLRLIVQEPGVSLGADHFGTAGALYKAQSGGSFTYRGLDPDEYDGSFRQVSGEGQVDLTPLIEFIRWVEESSDEEFAAGLEERLDVDSFAHYLALHNLLLDFDDMSGPGQNYYLWWEADTGAFTVVSWDLNLSWSGDPAQGPFEEGSFSPAGAADVVPGGGTARPPGGHAPGGGVPSGAGLPGGLPSPPGAGPIPGGERPDGGAGLRPGREGTPAVATGHLLEDRFLEVAAFRGLYEEAYRSLYRQLFAEGIALEVLDGWAQTLAGGAGELIDIAILDDDVARLRRLITERTAALAGDPVITG